MSQSIGRLSRPRYDVPRVVAAAGNASQPTLCCFAMESLASNPDVAEDATEWQNAMAAARRAATIAYYDQRSDDYAAMTGAIDTTDQIAKFAALLPRGGRVLDIGCGAGRDLIGLDRAGLRPVGLDISMPLATIAGRKSKMPVKVGDLRNPPFGRGSFNGIWAMASLLHVELGEISGALEALRDVLVPGGVLFASVKRGRGLVRGDEGRWFTLHDEASWSRHLTNSGFRIIEVVGEPPTLGNATGSITPGWISSLARKPA